MNSTHTQKRLMLNQNNQGYSNEDLSDYVFGRVQPQAIELEEAVLGALMLDKDALPSIIDILRPESFYPDRHGSIYKAMVKLFNRTNPVDLLTVTEELKKSGELEEIGGPHYLVELTNRVASAANIEYHSRIILQKHLAREVIKVCTRTIRNAYDPTIEVFEMLDLVERDIFNIGSSLINKETASSGKVMADTLKYVELASQQSDGLTGIPSGFVDLDRLTGGWQPTDLIIVAARPGMGKSSLTLSLALNAALDFDKGVAFFSLEMGKVQLGLRMVSQLSEIPASKLKTGKLYDHEWQQLQSATEKIAASNIHIDDTPGINILELRAKCRRLKMQHDIQLVIIDYLQLMTGDPSQKNGNREQEISGISRALKGLAKELNVPVIALSQLSRAVETRGGTKRPQLSDLRESGAIEQDADIVSFIYRPEYYNILEDEEGESLKGISEIIVAKHRSGALNTIKLKYISETTKFDNLGNPNFKDFIQDEIPQSDPIIISRSNRMNDEDIPF